MMQTYARVSITAPSTVVPAKAGAHVCFDGKRTRSKGLARRAIYSAAFVTRAIGPCLRRDDGDLLLG